MFNVCCSYECLRLQISLELLLLSLLLILGLSKYSSSERVYSLLFFSTVIHYYYPGSQLVWWSSRGGGGTFYIVFWKSLSHLVGLRLCTVDFKSDFFSPLPFIQLFLLADFPGYNISSLFSWIPTPCWNVFPLTRAQVRQESSRGWRKEEFPSPSWDMVSELS